MTLSVSTERTPTGVRLIFAGDIDIGTSDELAEVITSAITAGPGSVVVDLAGVPFCDCSGVRALIAGRDLALRLGSGYRVAGAHDLVLRVLQILGHDKALATDTVDGAGY